MASGRGRKAYNRRPMRAREDLGLLAEIACSAETPADYERAVLDLVQRRVGFDVGFFKRADGFGPVTPGLDPVVRRKTDARWAIYAEEASALVEAATRSGGVIVDAEYFGARLERLAYYDEIIRPHRGRATGIAFLVRRGALVGGIGVGRCRPTFRDSELEYLRAIAPTLAICEATVHALPTATWTSRVMTSSLTKREREVLGYLHLGYTNAQIAKALGTAARTVRNQLSSAYEKLGVGSRAEAVDAVAALGIGRGSP